jgi:hypothetical protein
VASVLLRAVRRLQKAAPPAPKLAAVLEPEPDAQAVAEMSLEDFAHAGLVVKVKSRLLGEEVLFVSDNVRDLDESGPVVYRAAELRLLEGKTPEDVKRLHRMKAIFGGTLTEKEPTK